MTFKKILSVRTILALYYSVLLLAASAIFGYATYSYLERLLQTRFDDSLKHEVEWLTKFIDKETKGKILTLRAKEIRGDIDLHFQFNPRNHYVLVKTNKSEIFYQSGNLAEKPLYTGDVTKGIINYLSVENSTEEKVRVAAINTGTFTAQVAYPESEIFEPLDHIKSIFLILAPIMILFTFTGGWILAGGILRPIQEISKTAERISASNLSERIPSRGVDDELSRLIKTINMMIERLEASFDQMRQFSMDIAHELKTPLTIIKGEAELAIEQPLTAEEHKRLIANILEEITRVSRIIDDLLTLTKAETKQITIKKEAIQLLDIVEDVFDDALILAANKNINVTFSQKCTAMILGDNLRLQQLFRNLLVNAIKFTPQKGGISFAIKNGNNSVEVSIQDNGIGIPKESLDKIFHRFYRVDEARNRTKGGTGLGLAIAKWIAEAHGGSIKVESTIGEGSVFTVNLPLLPDTIA
jgi:two-component system, OmpR family, sensor kinase